VIVVEVEVRGIVGKRKLLMPGWGEGGKDSSGVEEKDIQSPPSPQGVAFP